MLKERENEEGLIDPAGSSGALFREGERVKVLAGPMQGLEGMFQCMRGEDRVVVLLSWLSRQVRAEVAVDEVIALR